MRIGTRGSALALVQARWVADWLEAKGEAPELVEITTSGDRGAAVDDKSRWTSELERALLEDRIDVAVHSAKDVPADLADGTILAGVPPREDPRDVLCGAASLEALPHGARIGTSSLRRAAQLRALRQDLEIVELRGNVDSRLRKLAGGQADALVLALAGLRRLGREAEAGGRLDGLVPAAGQGALALQTLTASPAQAAVAALSDPAAAACVAAERELVRGLGASCQTAVGAYARLLADGTMELTGWAGLPDGSEWISDRVSGPAAELGLAVARRMLAAGAGELLRASASEATAR
jgi:hydroxymethylbilane synthase